MPGVDFRAVRQAVSMQEVLDLIGFVAQVRTGRHAPRCLPSASFAVAQEPVLRSTSAPQYVSLFPLRRGGQSAGSLCRGHASGRLRRGRGSVCQAAPRRSLREALVADRHEGIGQPRRYP